MKYFVGCLVLILIVLHQDYWQWDRADIVFGFIPYPLAYHMGISLATAIVWVLVVNLCWPKSREEFERRDKDSMPADSDSDADIGKGATK